MTAVAPPLTSFQQSTRWTSDGNGFGATMDSEDVTRMFNPGPRKTAQRQNSSSSIASSSSSTSTISASSIPRPNGPLFPSAPSDPGSWAVRKKPARGLWPPGKAEPATGISTARPQTVNSVISGPTASSAISALHVPLMPPQQIGTGLAQANGVVLREQGQSLPSAILHLVPMNGTFERKTITVPYAPDVLRIGRQTNQKTIPTPTNGYFDSKVLSRQHAEVYADRQGRILIRDVKSSNGTFVNGMRLSQENKESEPRELREGDQLELGIDIVSEDQKTVVHHKVAAKVEHAGIYGQVSDNLNFVDLDPSAGNGLITGPHPLKRSNSSGSMNGRGTPNSVVSQAAVGIGGLNQPAHMRNWLNPITTEHIVKKLNAEMKLAMQQSQEITRARQAIELMLSGKTEAPIKELKSGSDRMRPSPVKPKVETKTHFSEPPAPPPQAPLPQKPDVARALADPVIQPLLRRTDTARAPSANSSPTRTDHSGDILRLCEELKLAKGELSSQSERMRSLESELAQERTARESAEERAQRLEQTGRRDSPTNNGHPSADNSPTSITDVTVPPDLQAQLDRLSASLDEMKQQMEQYRQRATTAEMERDIARKSLAEMIEEKRKENAELSSVGVSPKSTTKSRRGGAKAPSTPVCNTTTEPDSDIVSTATQPRSPTYEKLFERAGLEEGKPITQEQAEIMTRFLAQEVLSSQTSNRTRDGALHHTLPYGSFAAVILLGYVAMTWINRWPKIEK